MYWLLSALTVVMEYCGVLGIADIFWGSHFNTLILSSVNQLWWSWTHGKSQFGDTQNHRCSQDVLPVYKGYWDSTRRREVLARCSNLISRPRICYFEGFSAALALPNHCSLPNPVHLRVKPKNVLSLFILYLREIIPEMTE